MTRCKIGPLGLLYAAMVFGLAACADNLPCDATCTPAMWDAQDTLQVDPLSYGQIFGKEWVAGVSEADKTATQHYPARGAR